MKLPALFDYQLAVQTPDISFIDPALSRGVARRTPLGSPTVASGGFALTFDITANGQRFAVRCFHKQGNQLRARYAEVAEFISRHRSLDFLIDVAYLADGIKVQGNVFPIVRMPWVAGTTLDEWVEDHLGSPDVLDAVRRQVRDATASMRNAGMAHGDLQHGNILVDPTNRIRLVDYDGMFLPSLRNLGASENGHRNYQHPGRGNSYDQHLDWFAAAVIDISIDALRHDRALWRKFNTGENLLFSATDFVDPDGSAVFSQLTRIPAVSERVQRLRTACLADFASASAILSGERPSRPPLRRPTPSDRPITTGPPLILAHDRAILLANQGDEVTVIGRIAGTRQHVSYGKTTTFINFGDYRRGDFTIVAFDRASQELRSMFGANLEDLEQSWISLTGLLTLYQSRWSKDPTPEIELKRPRSLRLLDSRDVETLIAQAQPPAARPSQPAASAPGSPRPASAKIRLRPPQPQSQPQPASQGAADDLARRLADLYSTPGFARPASPRPAPPPPSRPAPSSTPALPAWNPRPGPPSPPPNQWAQRPRPVMPRANPKSGWWTRLRRKLGL